MKDPITEASNNDTKIDIEKETLKLSDEFYT